MAHVPFVYKPGRDLKDVSEVQAVGYHSPVMQLGYRIYDSQTKGYEWFG